MAVTDFKGAAPNPGGGGGKGKGGGSGSNQNWNNNDKNTPFVPKKETPFWPQWKSGGQTKPGSPTGSGINNPVGMQDPCKYGWKCKDVLTTGKCSKYHPKDEFKFLIDKFRAQASKKGTGKGPRQRRWKADRWSAEERRKRER
jgi:hypothetical protein